MAHPFLQRLRSDSSTQSFGCLSTQHPAPETYLMEDQMGQLQGSIEKLKCFNRLLLAVLQGYKGRCESLSIKLAKREAEATALRLALQYSEDCEEVYEVLLALKMAGLGTGVGTTKGDLQAAEKEASRLLMKKEATMEVETPQPSSEGSGVDKPTPEELASQLHGYVQHLRERWALVKIPEELGPVTAPKATMPHAEATVQAILEIQPGPTLPHLEKSQIQQDLAATRDRLADLVLRLQLTQREKRGLELREAALRAQGPAHQLLLQQLRWERAHFAGDGSSGGSSEDPSSEEEAGEDRQQHYQGNRPAGTAAVPAAAAGTGDSEGPNQTCSECRAVQRTVQGSQCSGLGLQRSPPEAGRATPEVGAAGGSVAGSAGRRAGSADSHR